MRPARPSTQTPRKLAPGCPLQVRAAHIYPLAGFPLPSLADARAKFIFTKSNVAATYCAKPAIVGMTGAAFSK
ncbi:MAG: hypothetical protein ACK5QG_09590 [Bacteroidota bacterium]|jgi:hypothetical protein|nr:hypothetical protein [Flammeovirgaceae bacterium]